MFAKGRVEGEGEGEREGGERGGGIGERRESGACIASTSVRIQ